MTQLADDAPGRLAAARFRRPPLVVTAALLSLLSATPGLATGPDPLPARLDRDRLLDLLLAADFRSTESVESATAMRREAQAAGDAGAESLALSIECRAQIRLGDLPAAGRACDTARRLAPEGDDLAVFAAGRMTGMLQVELGQPVAALDGLVAAQAAATRSGEPAAIAAALASVGVAAQFAGAGADAIDNYARALALAQRVGAHDVVFVVANNLGELLRESGDLAGAIEHYEIALSAAAGIGDDFDPVGVRASLALARLELGQADAAPTLESLRGLIESPAMRQRPALRATVQLGLARAESRRGRHAVALAATRDAIASLRGGWPARAHAAAAQLLDVLVAAGELDEAERAAAQSMREVPEDARGRAELLEARERLFAARGRYRDAYQSALEARRIRDGQSLARAGRALSFVRARTEAEARSLEISTLRASQSRAQAEVQQERIVRNLVLALLAMTLAGSLALLAVARARRRLATELEQRRSSDALGKLTGGVAHDFNNLMTIVQQAMGLLRRDAAVRGSAQALELVDEAEQAARLGGDITQRLLAYARQQRLNPELLALGPYLEAQRPLFERALGATMRLTLEVADADGRVRVDPGQLTTVVINLLTNARDAMQEQGTVRVRVDSVVNTVRDRRWPELAPGRYLTLAVIDTGSGMSPEVLRQATLPFFTTKVTDGGTGLGLSTAHGIARQSHGHLQIESTPGVGTIVTLVLPQA